MAYPFVKYPSFAEFKKILKEEFSCDYKKLAQATLVDPDGIDHEVFYFERQEGNTILVAAVDLTDDTMLTPSLLRSICSRLHVPVQHFGLTLG